MRQNIVWCDLEFTTTELERAAVMQAAMVVTTPDLEPIAPPGGNGVAGLAFDVRLCMAQLESASEWVRQNQAAQLERCLNSPTALSIDAVDSRLFDYVLATCDVPSPGVASFKNPLLAGNSVHHDYHLIRTQLPQLSSALSYRLLDISTLKELVLRWAPELRFDRSTARDYLPAGMELIGEEHDALFDVQCSIAELRYYRKTFLRTATRA